MDWPQDGSLYDAMAPRNVFKYSEMPTTVVRLSPGLDKPTVWTMENMDDWDKWFKKEYPALDGTESGLVLILARRNGERDFPPVRQVKSDEWLEKIECHETDQPREQPTSSNKNGQRTLRILPFSQDSFHIIVNKFYVHGMIARAISRADIPAFSAAEVEMSLEDEQTHSAFVYNCRTSNAWPGDLALTATYFPHCKLTFAIMFGCPISTEKQVLQRLGKVKAEADHPLLMPGILVELERQRHVCLVDNTINELETQILEIDMLSEDLELMSTEEQARRKQAKRAAWLDTTYLRDQLSNWIVNLEKLQNHADELNHTIFKMSTTGPASAVVTGYRGPQEPPSEVFPDHCSRTPKFLSYEEPTDWIDLSEDGEKGKAYELYPLETEFCKPPSQPRQPLETDKVQDAMERAGNKIKSRLRDIIDEYHEKVRDCTMRVDGMAMATQWAQGETNLEIAIAASRDSRHMRSIAVITMIFLPGTFFAVLVGFDVVDIMTHLDLESSIVTENTSELTEKLKYPAQTTFVDPMSQHTSEKRKGNVAFKDVDEAESATGGDLPQSPKPSVTPVYAATNPIEVLGQELRQYMIVSQEKGRDYEFLPRNELDKLLSEERITEALEMALARTEATNTPDSTWKASPGYLDKRKEIVAILILIGKLERTLDFIAEGIDDNHLPFELERGPTPRRTLNRRDSDGQSTSINLFSSWGIIDLEAFDAQQWKIHVPVFGEIGNRAKTPPHWDLGKRTILPYLESSLMGEGGFGAVSKVKLHPGHYKGVKDMAEYYAVKKLTDSSEDAFREEVSSLWRFSHEEPPNLIKLLWTFSRDTDYYLVFPCAEGNLMEFWKDTAPLARTGDPDAARWVARQCLGIIDGLCMIHKDTRDAPSEGINKRHGRHGDLKPENILRFVNGGDQREGYKYGVLTISDFGLADFHDTSSKSQINTRLNKVGVSLTYRAPEYDVHEKIAQNYDIWSLACVLVEFLMWYLKGWDEVQNFSKARAAEDNHPNIKWDTFFNYVQRGDGGNRDQQCAAQAKQSVYNAFRDLYEDENASDFSNDLVKLVETKMLRLNPNSRASCTEIYAEFKKIYDACEADSNYCLGMTKRPRRRRDTGG
ncbi:hypothetical protein CDV31_012022 [Fusarium ambrosium]|uniref:Protein kinase domain-containing protein n=1 Tax=Fusarium ambrosium TaxID=131363 RepID=A0A428TCZ4_9HYPO|nr:hypothetical protein CDV31_012022 [Fusarium ambrosium]